MTAHPPPTKVGIVGCGLIGASLALLVKRSIPDATIVAYERNAAHVETLRSILPDLASADALDGLSDCRFVFVCTPPSTIGAIVCDLIATCSDETVIVDAGSVKSVVVEQVSSAHPSFDRFVPGHPLAGSPASGPTRAGADILLGKPYVLTPYAATSEAAVAAVSAFLKDAGLRVFCTDADRHDRVVAMTSHVTHVIAFALVDRLRELEQTEFESGESSSRDDMLYFLGGSILGMTEFAASDPVMWSDILRFNADKIREETARLCDRASTLAAWSGEADAQDIVKRLEETRAYRVELEARKDEDF